MKPISLLAAFFYIVAVAVVIVVPGMDAAAKGRSLIRDAEIENTIQDYASPLFKAAGLIPESVNIFIIRDARLNAFVMGGQNLFLHTGLITQADNASQIIGVIAHEAGHIAGGHLVRSRDALENARIKSIIATVLGGVVALGTGRGDVGAAILQGGSGVGARGYLHFSRTQEAAADHAALTFLDKSNYSAKGLLQFMSKLEDQELLSASRQSPYMRTHPMSRDRFLTVRAHLEKSSATEKVLPTRFNADFLRIRAKLHAFLEPYGRVLQRYPSKDQSLAARYARAIALYRKPNMPEALRQIDALISEHPNDPYFLELKGQALFENGRPHDAIPPYQAAVRLLPTSSLLRRDLARVQIDTGDAALLPTAIKHLSAAVKRDPRDTFAWHQLAIAHGRMGNMDHSALALAEEAIRQGRKEAALHHAGKVQLGFPLGSLQWLQAQDIIEAANLLGKRP